MFENIIGQGAVVGALRNDLRRDELPRATLLVGPPYSGKLSVALEVARVLTCGSDRGDWACNCGSCAMQKELSHPHTVLLGSRYSEVEIPACADSLTRTRKLQTQYLFLRSVRKLVRRFDSAVWEAEDARMKAALAKVSEVEELLADLLPGKDLPEPPELEKLTGRIVEACRQLAGSLKSDLIGIGQVRKLAAWAHLTAFDSRKIAILENADRMQESARNALLKLLEEPPQGVHIILLASRRSAIIPTILSRLRPYTFVERSAEEETEVLAKIFRLEDTSFSSLRGFFLTWRETDPEALVSLSRRFMELVHSPAGEGGAAPADILAEMAGLFSQKSSQRDLISSFFEELTLRFREALRGDPPDLETLEEWNAAIREGVSKVEIYNMSPSTVLESLFYQMRGRVHGALREGSGAQRGGSVAQAAHSEAQGSAGARGG